MGVSIARAVSVLATKSATVGEQTAEQVLSYTHTISIEISRQDSGLAWKGEATWDSYELNLINRIVPVFQLILSDLPSDRSFRPEIPEVKNSHVENYYKLECRGNWFTCPALPYRIFFGDPTEGKKKSDPHLPTGINNASAFAAYTDLIQTAEFALPDGEDKDWKNPIRTALWEKVTLGGRYLLGPNRKPTNIMIKLIGRSDGYYIVKCWIATEDEYAHFEQRIQRWQQALADYYNVF